MKFLSGLKSDPRAARLAVFALIGLCAASSARFVFAPTRVDLLLRRPWTLEQYDRHFDELRSLLPPRAVVGYVGNQDQDELVNYLVTQYSLAPVVVDRSPEHDLVVGNFSSPAFAVPPRVPTTLRIRRDFGNGLFLFEKRPE